MSINLLNDLLNLYYIYARKKVKTATTTTTQIEKAHYLVQKDTTGDNVTDIEFSYEQTLASISAEIDTREKISLYFQVKPYTEMLQYIEGISKEQTEVLQDVLCDSGIYWQFKTIF